FLVDEERADAPAGRSFEPRQLVLVEDVSQSALPNQRSTGITVPAKDQSLYAFSAVRRQPARARGRRLSARRVPGARPAAARALSDSTRRSADRAPRRRARTRPRHRTV